MGNIHRPFGEGPVAEKNYCRTPQLRYTTEWKKYIRMELGIVHAGDQGLCGRDGGVRCILNHLSRNLVYKKGLSDGVWGLLKVQIAKFMIVAPAEL